MEYRDYYATLGVPRTAGAADIKKAFRKLARQHHPDVNKGDAAAEKRFKELTEANEVLSDPEKRKLYDQLGADWQSYQQGGTSGARPGQTGSPFDGFAGYGGSASGPGVRFQYRGNAEDLAGFSDFFRTFFGGGPQTQTRSRAHTASIDDLFADFGNAPTTNTSARQRNAPRLQAEVEVTLDEVAQGTKRLLEIEGKRIEVNIPAGATDGQKIRFSGVVPGGGDVYLKVKVRPHPTFTRKGPDLHSELPLTLREAVIGAEVPVKTLGRRVLLRIPPETQNGRIFRLAGKGLPKLRSEGNGDLYAKVKVVLPKGLSAEAKEAASAFLDLVDQPDPRSS